MENSSKTVLGLSRTLFWDCDPDKVDTEKHAEMIVEKVLNRGTLDEFKTIVKFYGKPKLSEFVVNYRYMDNILLSFCSAYFNIPKEKFRCYTQKQLKVTHWDY